MSAQIVIRLPAEQKSELELTAQKMNITLSDLVKQGIDLVLKKVRTKRKKSMKEFIEFAQMNVKDMPDKGYDPYVSQHIDEILYSDPHNNKK